jgi:uncharacterized membrane protein YhaH (DUF805 family)
MFQPLKKYAEFKGRASRSEYWLFFLFNFLVILTAMLLRDDGSIVVLAWLGLAIPNLAVGVRRLHDINMSGWWLLLSLIPFLGSLIMFVFALIPGTEGDNRFGADPTAEPAEAA